LTYYLGYFYLSILWYRVEHLEFAALRPRAVDAVRLGPQTVGSNISSSVKEESEDSKGLI
jgi:hypothetical protein